MELLYDGIYGDYSRRLIHEFGGQFGLSLGKLDAEIAADLNIRYEIIQEYTDTILDSDGIVLNDKKYQFYWDAGDLFIYNPEIENPWKE